MTTREAQPPATEPEAKGWERKWSFNITETRGPLIMLDKAAAENRWACEQDGLKGHTFD